MTLPASVSDVVSGRFVNDEVYVSESPRARFRRRFFKQKGAVIALAFVILLVLTAIFAPWLTPQDPDAQDLSNIHARPFDGSVLGTDNLGRDTLSRLIVATRVMLLAVVQALGVALAISVIPGLAAGYFGKWVDGLIMWVTNAVMSFPALILAIALVGVLGADLRNAMIAVGIVFAPTFLRLIRGSVIAVRNETFVEASRSIGTPARRIMARHILPNVLSPLLVQISLMAGLAILAESSLSYIGLGVQPPDSSWGTMLRDGFSEMETQPWLVGVPGLAIAFSVLAFNVLGDGIRDSLGREVRSE